MDSAGSVKPDKQPRLRLMIFTTDDAESDWSSMFNIQPMSYEYLFVEELSHLASLRTVAEMKKRRGRTEDKKMREESNTDWIFNRLEH